MAHYTFAVFILMPMSSALAQPEGNRVADKILTALQAANAVRGENAREAQRWKEERQRLQVLEATLRQRIEQQKLQQKKLKAEIANLREQNKELEPQRLLISQLKKLATTKANLIHEVLEQKSKNHAPGVIQKKTDKEREALNQIQSALNRLEATENNMKNVTVELATGVFQGKPLAVELLRLGGALAWWRSFDGKKAGHATVQNGVLKLIPSDVAADRRAINLACNIAKGRAAPELVLLPIRSQSRTNQSPEKAQ